MEKQKRSVLGEGSLTLDAYLAGDLAVVNTARVSFDQHSEELSERDEGLIGFLMRDRHGSPFEHGYFRFLVEAPLMVVREHQRHRIGHSYNEWSGRYSQMEPKFYIPHYVRTQTGKPGAYTFEPVSEDLREETRNSIENSCWDSFSEYTRLLEMGIAKEVARIVLPLSMYTKYYWSCNPRSLMHFLGLRNSEHAMYEIREYAIAAEEMFREIMPVTHSHFISNGRVAP